MIASRNCANAYPSGSADERALLVPGARALEHLLILGSDSRLHLDPGSQLNSYGCRTSPRPHEISVSSSTASTISQRAFSAVDAAYRELCRSTTETELECAFEQLAATTKQRLKAHFNLSDGGVEVVLSPSGTDSELQALFLAGQALGKSVTSIIVAADETGSSVGLAAAGRHFGLLSSGGRTVVRGEPIHGLGTGVTAVHVNARDQFGEPRSAAEIDDEVRRSASEAITAGRGVVLHLMDHSKLGSRCPSPDCIQDIRARWGRSVQVVVDACQARLSRSRLRWYLDQGFMVIVTGSKFFTGPPLSGALFVPAYLRPRASDNNEVLAGLSDYTARHDWSENWTSVRSALPSRTNVGQLLRWTAALEEIRAYFAVPELFRKIVLTEFAAAASRCIAEYPNLHLLAEPEWLSGKAGDDAEFGVRTIFPFVVMKNGRPLTLAESRIVYEALNQDLSLFIPSRGTGADARLLAQLCHVGQPVGVRHKQADDAGAIRISADARLVSESWSAANEAGAIEKMRTMIGALRMVFEKIQLVMPHIEELRDRHPAGPHNYGAMRA